MDLPFPEKATLFGPHITFLTPKLHTMNHHISFFSFFICEIEAGFELG